MFKTKLFISITVFVIFLARILEKKITNLNTKIFNKKRNINEAQLDFYYLTSPAEIEKKIKFIEFENYQPIKYSNIFFDISEFTKLHSKISDIKKFNEKKN